MIRVLDLMRWNAARHTKRPPASNKGARWAWDAFLYGETQPEHNRYGKEVPPRHRLPKEMTYKFMDYWVWVMEFENGDFEEIDSLVSAHHSRSPETTT